VTTSDVRRIELPFEINGLIDPITLTHTPSYFYDLLQRDIRRSDRKNEKLALITIDFSASTILAKKMIDFLMMISLILKQSLRGDEYFSRIGFEKFAILIHGDRAEASVALNRMQKELKKIENDSFSIIYKAPTDGDEHDGPETNSLRSVVSGSSVEVNTQIFVRDGGMSLVEWLEVASI
jgi:GGDEF domain-containing protein